MTKIMKWFPESKLGKYSFWLVISGFLLMYSQYWIAMLFNISIPVPLGLLSIILVVIFGTTAIVAIIKDKDRAILLFLAGLLGLLGYVMIIGELIFPH